MAAVLAPGLGYLSSFSLHSCAECTRGRRRRLAAHGGSPCALSATALGLLRSAAKCKGVAL